MANRAAAGRNRRRRRSRMGRKPVAIPRRTATHPPAPPPELPRMPIAFITAAAPTLALVATLALPPQVRVDASTTRDTAGKKDTRVSISVGDDDDGNHRHRARRTPVTEQHLATAF